MPTTPTHRLVASIVAASVAFLGWSCRPTAEQAPEGAGASDYEFVGDEGGVDLPDDFPARLPLYPGALPVSVMRMGEAGMHVTFRVDVPIEDLQAWYAERLRADGWKVPVDSRSENGGMVVAERPDLSVTLMLTAGEAGVTRLTVLHESPQGRDR